MAVVLKDVRKETEEKNLKLVSNQKANAGKVVYEFPYDDMYLLYDYILKEMQKKE